MTRRDHNRLTILNVAYPYSPVGSDAVGGAEQILSQVDHAPIHAGHVSLVAASEDSQVAGRLFAVPALDREVLEGPERRWYTAQLEAAIERALLLYFVDLVHMHGLDFYKYTMPPAIPTLVTLHTPIEWYGVERSMATRERAQLCCVSESQRRSCPSELGDLPVVENGVSLDPWRPVEKRNFAVVLGRICPEKNILAALQAGTRAHMPVVIGGRVFPYRDHQAYFDQELKPLLGNPASAVRHEFLGTVSSTERQELLARAKCLLHPTLAPETSSLVAMEALACGTPVIAYRSGALCEIVEHGVTGFLVDSVEEWRMRFAVWIRSLPRNAAGKRSNDSERNAWSGITLACTKTSYARTNRTVPTHERMEWICTTAQLETRRRGTWQPERKHAIPN